MEEDRVEGEGVQLINIFLNNSILFTHVHPQKKYFKYIFLEFK